MSIISLILIILVHYLFTFFMINLTIPKVKDLVNKPQQQYDILYNTIKKEPTLPNISIDNESMKTELKNYLKELNNTSNNTSNNKSNSINDIEGLLPNDTAFSNSNYSTF